MSNMYEIIDRLCKEKAITITALSREIGISKSTMSELKMGRSQSLSAKNLDKIATYFNVPIGTLLGNQEKKPLINEDEELAAYLEELKNRSDMRMLFSLAKGATKEEVIQAVKIIEALRNK